MNGHPCVLFCLFLGLTIGTDPARAADTLVDMEGAVTPLIRSLGPDIVSNEVRYEVRLRNDTAEPIPFHSLLIVLDRLSNPASEDRDAYKGDRLIAHVEIVNKDGTTPDGRAFFRLPIGSEPDLPPHRVSEPILVRIQIPDYMPAFPPAFRVLGQRRPGASASLAVLIQVLIEKGVLTREEWESAVARWERSR